MLGFLGKFLDSNDREINKLRPIVERINQLEKKTEKLSDSQLKDKFEDLKKRHEKMIAELANSVISTGMGLLLQGHNDRRQLRQQKKLQDMQIEGQKEMTDYNTEASRKAQLQMWRDTNYGAQRDELKKAGMSVGLMYGGGGGGGATTGAGATGGSVSGAMAPTGGNEIMAMRMQSLNERMQEAQIEATKAQTAKTQVETEKIGGVDKAKTTEETRGIKFNNDLNDTLKDTTISKKIAETDLEMIKRDRESADWETYLSVGYRGGNFKDPDSEIAKAMRAGFEKATVNLEIAKKENNILDAKQIITDFEANLAKEGIHPNSPWGVKFVIDLLKKIDLNPLNLIK